VALLEQAALLYIEVHHPVQVVQRLPEEETYIGLLVVVLGCVSHWHFTAVDC
jgi:hypothetical protein